MILPFPRNSLLFLIIFFIGICLAYLGINLPPLVIIGITIGALLALVVLTRPQWGLVIFVLAMLLSPEIKVAQLPHRAVVVRLEDIFLIIVFLAWFVRVNLSEEKGLIRRTPLNRPILVYILLGLLSTSLAILRGDVHALKSIFYYLKYVEFFLFYFLVVNLVTSRRQVIHLLWAGLFTCIAVNLYGYFTMGKIPRLTAPFEGGPMESEPASFGGYLLLVFGIVMALFMYHPVAKIRLAFLALIAFIIPVFVGTLSRASFVSFPPLFITLLAFTRRHRLQLTGLLLISILSFPLLFSQMWNKVVKRMDETFIGRTQQYAMAGFRVQLEPSAALRVEAWKEIFRQKLSRHPLLGYGITGVGLVDAQYPRVVGEMGLLGFFTFFWLIGAIFRNAYNIFRQPEIDYLGKSLSLGLIAGLVALLAQSLTTNTFVIVRIMEPFWFLTALVMAYPRVMKET